MTFRIPFAAIAATVLLSLPLAAQDHPDGLHVHDIYARSMGTVGASGAIFLTIHNNSETDDRLVAAASDVAQRVELHTHKEDANGVMQMMQVAEGFAIPAGDMHVLARGGDHVMLLGLTRELKEGDSFPVTLTFEQAGEVVVEAVVDNARKPDAGGMMMMDHGDGHGHGHGHGHGSGG